MMMKRRARGTIGILASGTGSNAMAIIDAVERGDIRTQIGCVLSDRPGAPVVQRARERGIPTVVVDRAGYDSAEIYERRVVEQLHRHGAHWVALAGYMRLCGPQFLDAFAGRTLNVHPALLPAFPGRDALADALDAGVDTTGVTVHFIDAGIDSGPIICRVPVAIDPRDDRTSLAARIHPVEHDVLPLALEGLVDGAIRLDEHGAVLMPRAWRARFQHVGAQVPIHTSPHQEIQLT